ncbi:MAG: hypothetical protein EOS52_30060 [Mesorhizobium sp.]|nr:MAG: hypothetical protein EOS52_30060 [Mesorhizobium sp.]
MMQAVWEHPLGSFRSEMKVQGEHAHVQGASPKACSTVLHGFLALDRGRPRKAMQMTNVISFATRKPVSGPDEPMPEAIFGILAWDDPIMRNFYRELGRIHVDGLVPIEIAEKMKVMCDEWNANRVASSG